ncbi:MAG: hypothetical protein ACKO8G_05150 [Actinomycetota bacterium]
MRVVEYALAALLAAGGVRSLVRWAGRGFAARDAADHVLFAVYLTGRIGLWFAFAGFFLIAASVSGTGVAAAEELGASRWFLLVPLVLATMQLVAGVFLGRRGGADGADGAGD